MTRILGLILLLVPALFAAGSVSQTFEARNNGELVVITASWTGDSANGSVPATVITASGGSWTPYVPGRAPSPEAVSIEGFSIIRVVTDPGSTAPTDNYDITITDARGADLMGGECMNRDTATTETCASDPLPVYGAITLNISGNSTNNATGTVVVYLVRQTVAKRGGAGDGGGMVLLDTCTASASVSCNFAAVVSATYDVYEIQLKSLILTNDNVFLMMRMSTNGSTFDSGNNYKYYNHAWSAAGAGIDQADDTSHIRFAQAEAWDTAQTTYSYNSTVRLYNPASAALWKFVQGPSIYVGQSNLPAAHIVSGVYKSATAVTGFQFIPSDTGTGGTIASGTIRVYGIAN